MNVVGCLKVCIEIVHRLIELKLLEVIHTTDGKEYLTPNELGKEIREELTVHGGWQKLICHRSWLSFLTLVLLVLKNYFDLTINSVHCLSVPLLFATGRVNLVDLQQALNIDLSHVETKVNELVKNDRSVMLVLGQLIDR